jgi:hypothetical protein
VTEPDPFMQPDAAPVPGEIVNGRYALPHPLTGEPATWARTTNFIKKLDDTFALDAWKLRQTVLGLALREDLYAEACTLADEPDDPRTVKKLDRLVENAHDAAGGNHGRRVGSALHKFTERTNRGLESGAPERWADKVVLYAEALRAHCLTVVPELIERTVVNLTYNSAGTFDNGFLEVDGRLVLADLKSQKKIYGYGSPALQFAMYVNADAMWNPQLGKYEDMPAFRKDVAKLLWLPIEGDACEVHDVDIARGWEALKLCDQVRLWQNEAKRKNAVGGLAAPPDAMAVTEAYAKRVLEAGSQAELSAIWREADALGRWSGELMSMGAKRLEEIQDPVLTTY